MARAPAGGVIASCDPQITVVGTAIPARRSRESARSRSAVSIAITRSGGWAQGDATRPLHDRCVGSRAKQRRIGGLELGRHTLAAHPFHRRVAARSSLGASRARRECPPAPGRRPCLGGGAPARRRRSRPSRARRRPAGVRIVDATRSAQPASDPFPDGRSARRRCRPTSCRPAGRREAGSPSPSRFHRMRAPIADSTSSTASVPVALRSSSTGFTSTTSSDDILPLVDSISIARWASR